VKLPFTGKSQPAEKTQEPEQEQEPFRQINVDEARTMMEGGQVTLIDVREPYEYAAGHLPGARLVPLRNLLSKPQEYLNADNISDNIVFVCASGERSAVACEMAASLGFTHVYNVSGGTYDWMAKGYPVER